MHSFHGLTDTLRFYGTDAEAIEKIAREAPNLAEPLHPSLPYRGAEVVWATQHEMAIHLEDVLARRTRALLLGVENSKQAAPHVAKLMAKQLGRNEKWVDQEVARYNDLAEGYLVSEPV